jgi:hypothetical protein
MSDCNKNQVGGTHYTDQKIQVWDYIVANDIPYLEGNVIRYVSRWRAKGGIEDLKKASHYVQKLIELEQARLDDGKPKSVPAVPHASSTVPQTEPCCECGEDYPRSDLLAGEVFCQKCRINHITNPTRK